MHLPIFFAMPTLQRNIAHPWAACQVCFEFERIKSGFVLASTSTSVRMRDIIDEQLRIQQQNENTRKKTAYKMPARVAYAHQLLFRHSLRQKLGNMQFFSISFWQR